MKSAFNKIANGLRDTLRSAECNHMFYWLHKNTAGKDVWRCSLCGITETDPNTNMVEFRSSTKGANRIWWLKDKA